MDDDLFGLYILHKREWYIKILGLKEYLLFVVIGNKPISLERTSKIKPEMKSCFPFFVKEVHERIGQKSDFFTYTFFRSLAKTRGYICGRGLMGL